MKKIALKGSGFLKNENQSSLNIPIGFAMALSTDVSSFKAFLALEDGEQDIILKRARSCMTQRERQMLADSLSKDKKY